MLQMTKTDILAPFEIWEVPLENGHVVKFHEPLTLKPNPCENNFQECDFEPLDISVIANTREELLNWIYSDIRMTWKHCVQKETSVLTPRNRQIKALYLSIAEEIHNG